MTTLSNAEVADVLEKAAERLELCPWGHVAKDLRNEAQPE